MGKSLHLAFGALVAAILFSASAQGAGHPEKLFNGRNLAGWVVMHNGHWAVEEGVLIGSHGTNWSTNPEKSGSWLRTSKQYQDFVLELEYLINQGEKIIDHEVDRSRKGYIGLQNHDDHAVVKFRNIRVTKL